VKFLLDTSVVSAPALREPNTKVVRKLHQQGASCAIAAPVWHELVFGAGRLPAGKRRAALEEYLHSVVRRSFPILPYDEAAADWHGRERARLEEQGRPTPFVDGQIAAIAFTRSLTLVTANAKDFRSFDGLEIVDWT
jgi:tRNA(fMet)-specific endonuclease VapC